MNTNELKCFAAVYEEKSINQAAQRLFITSQGLSRMIKNLETKLDTTLFERSQKGVIPTQSAEFLYERVNLLINQLDNIEEGLRQLELKNRVLRIACARGVLNALSFQLILDFIKSHPQIEVEWAEYANDKVKEMIAGYKADVGIVVGKSKEREFLERQIASREIILTVYEGHPYYDKTEISIADLKNEKILILNEEFRVYHEFKQGCMENGFEPQIVAKTVDSHFLYKLCKLKVGIGVLIDFSTEDFNLKGVKVIPLKEKIKWNIYQISNRQNQDFTNIKIFQEYLNKKA
ncbi:LysR family transcriptional regulator [Konateibacter massiliensis]|uniref:LysR family transcriptional regulator n=1 Tax=Konateibacter massiliensis TaxID=2002841 RepID=UPI000C159DC5|nr:LysR family transcriptional regulator [Konateibacter massiliensis]